MTREPHGATHSRRNIWLFSLDLILLAIAAGLALRAFWRPGMPIEADFLLSIYRTFALDQAWEARQFFPRLAMDLNFGLGGPLFQYYPPAGSYVTLVFRWLGLGWVEAAKATFTLALLMSGSGAYIFARWLVRDRRAGLVAGLAYMLSPYLLYCAYERGAQAELLALGLLPWLFLTTHRMLRPGGQPWVWPTAGLTALLMLTHNITALFALPLLALYLIGMAWRERAWQHLASVLLALGLGLGMSAFYWLPALAERNYAQIDKWMLQGDSAAVNNLASLVTLMQRRLVFDYWASRTPALALLQVALGAIGLLGLLVGNATSRRQAQVLAVLLLISLLLQLQISRALYETLPLLRYIQFPWRLLGVTSLFAALLVAHLFSWGRLAGAAGWNAAGALACLVLYGSLSGLRPPPDRWPYFSSAQVSQQDHFMRGRSGYWWLYNDYQPAGMRKDIAELAWPEVAKDGFGLPPLRGTPAIQVTAEGPADLLLRVQSAEPFTLRLPRIFFPGWRVWADGRRLPVAPSGPWGLLTIDLPAGDTAVRARFGETPSRAAADAVAAVCIVIWLIGLARERTMRPMLFGVVITATLLAGVSLSHHRLGQPARRPVSFAANLQDEVALLGYHLPSTSYHPGETVPIRLYWLARRTPARNYRVFLHLVTPDDTARVTQSDNGPQLDSRPTGRWHAGEIVVDEQLLEVPVDTPPGTYRLLAGLYDTEEARNLTVRSAPSVLPGDRLDLGLIEISGAP